jgi:autotransporter-associated beta strand protein
MKNACKISTCFARLIKVMTTILPIVALGIIPGQLKAVSDEYWRTDGTTGGTWTSTFWNAGFANAMGGTGWTSGNNAVFSANSTLTYVTGTLFGNVTVNDGFAATITAAGTASANSHTYTVGTGSTLAWSSQNYTAAGTSFVKNGAGIWNIGSIGNAYNGGFTLNAGTVIVSGDNSLGAAGCTINGGTIQSSGTRAFAATSLTMGGDIILTGTGNANWDAAVTIALGSSTRTIFNDTSSGSRQFRGLISGSSGAGITFSDSGSAQIYIGNTGNTFNGPIAINGGEVVFNDNGAFGNSMSITLDGGRLTMASMAADGSTSPLASATIASGKNVFVGSSTGTAISIQSASGVTTYNGVIANKPSSTGVLVKQGAGKLVLGGVSTYSGGTSNNNGTIQLATGNNRLPTTTSINLGQAASANVGTFDLNGFSQQIAGLNSVSGINTSMTAKNMVTNSSVTFATLTNSGSGSYAYGDGSTNNSGIIVGAINLLMNGTGTQTLGDTNTYSGNTFITNTATLALGANGSISSTPQVSIASGAAFDVSALASFTFTGSSPVQNLAGGSTSGTGNINATGKTVTLASGATASFRAVGGGNPSAGKISVTGNLALNNNAVTVSVDGGILGAGTYRLLDGTGTLTGSANATPAITGIGSILSGASVSISTTAGSAGHVDLIVSKVATSVSLNSSNNPSGYHDAVTFTATLPPAATSSVQFLTNGTALGSPALLTNGFAVSLSITNLPRGTNTITAQYAGDSNYLGSTNNLALGQIVTNHPPVANSSTYSHPAGFSLKIPLSSLSTNWSDADGDTISLTGGISSTNSADVSYDSQHVYYLKTNNAADLINYTVSDGNGGSATGVINIAISGGSLNQTQNITGITPNPDGSVTIYFASVPNTTNIVQRTASVVSPAWTDISTNVAGANGLWNYTDGPPAPPSPSFYRSQRQP